MRDLAGAGDSPTILMVMGLADWTDLYPAGIMGLHRIQAVGAAVLFNPGEFYIFQGFLYGSFGIGLF